MKIKELKIGCDSAGKHPIEWEGIVITKINELVREVNKIKGDEQMKKELLKLLKKIQKKSIEKNNKTSYLRNIGDKVSITNTAIGLYDLIKMNGTKKEYESLLILQSLGFVDIEVCQMEGSRQPFIKLTERGSVYLELGD